MLDEVARELQRPGRVIGGGLAKGRESGAVGVEKETEAAAVDDVEGTDKGTETDEGTVKAKDKPRARRVRVLSSKAAALLLYVGGPAVLGGVSMAGFVKLVGWAAGG